MDLPCNGSPWSTFGGSDGWLNLVHDFGGVEIAQTYSAIYWLGRCFKEHPQVKCILELGTLYGSLTSFFGLHFPDHVVTCDITERREAHAKILHKKLGIRFKLVDVLSSSAPRHLLSVCRKEIGYSSKSNILVFCDNGGKEKEFLNFAPHLRRGDLIAVHDYQTEFRPDRLEIRSMIDKLGLIQWREKELISDGAFIGIWEVPDLENNMNRKNGNSRKSSKKLPTDIQVLSTQPNLEEYLKPFNRPTYRFHVQGMPHTATGHPHFHHCAFTKNVRDFCKMMSDLGHHVIHYGGQGSVVDCAEHVTLVTKQERETWFKANWKQTQSDVVYDAGRPYWQTFNQRTIEAITQRLQPRDFICLLSGANGPVKQAFPNNQSVEFAIGYSGTVCDFRVYPSYAWYHWMLGFKNEENGRWITDAIIPHYLDPNEFPFNAKARERARNIKNRNFLYLGRALVRKGSPVAADIVARYGGVLTIAGQGFVQLNDFADKRIISNISTEKNLVITGDQARRCIVVGSADPKLRSELLANTRALMCPTIYIGPFELVHAEAQMCGVPVICTDWGAFTDGIVDGVTGFRVRTMAQALYACKHAGDLDPKVIREHAMKRWSLDAVAPQYQSYFDRLYSLWDTTEHGGFYSAGLL